MTQQEELFALRRLVEKQQEQLAAKDEIIEKQNSQLEKQRIHKYLMGCGVLHMDETRIQCNKEAGKKASSESFIWVIRSAACEKLQAAFFYYSRTRNGDTAKELLGKFYGYLITDAYSGYEKVEHIIRSLCWAHYSRNIVIPENRPVAV